MDENDLDATAIQCWTSLQHNFGVNVCTLMSMMSERLMPTACEVDITGVVSMYALQLASGTPSALVDWNNNYGDDPDKCVFFHCGNWAKSFIPDAEISTAPDPGHDAGRGEHLWRDGRAHARRPGDLCPRQHRRRARRDPHLCGRRPLHRRSAGHLWHARRGRRCRACRS